MNRLVNLFRQLEFQVFLFCAGAFLFNWPLLRLFNLKSLQAVFIYLFLAWTAVIFVLFMISRSLSDSSATGKVNSPGEDKGRRTSDFVKTTGGFGENR